MKRLSLATVGLGMLFFAGTPLWAQNLMLGFRAGASIANVNSDQVDFLDSSSRNGFTGGVFLNIGLGGNLSLQPEVLYSQKGFSVDEAGATGTAKLDYIDIPVLLKLSLTGDGQKVRPALFAGGFVSFESSCSLEVEAIGVGVGTDCDQDLERESTDAGVVFGGGVDIEVSDGLYVVLDGRYNLGLIDLDPDLDLASVKSQTWSFTGGLAIPLGG